MSSTAHGTTPYYYVPEPSRHPFMAAFGLFFVILGAGQWVNGVEWGKYSLFFGLAWWLGVLYQWFRDAVAESEGGLYGRKIDLSFRWSMSWFIFSEVMFFGAFFTGVFFTAGALADLAAFFFGAAFFFAALAAFGTLGAAAAFAAAFFGAALPRRPFFGGPMAESGSFFRMPAGFFAIFTPDDGHMPGLMDGTPVTVQKIVVKVKV